jgi:DNA-binding PadR family transcriptional regulator
MVVLALVCEEPMHPYRMQSLIKERGKDQIANVAQRNSVYQAIEALLRAGLIAIRETLRDERRPERTVYEPTEEGRSTLHAWLRAVLSTPAREFPDFPAALSLAPFLEPDDMRDQLELRVGALERRLAELEKPVPGLPRLFLIEEEYMAALVRTEIRWVRGLIGDLRSRRLTWSEAWLRRMAAEWAGQAGSGSEPDRTPSPAQEAGRKRRRSPGSGRLRKSR